MRLSEYRKKESERNPDAAKIAARDLAFKSSCIITDIRLKKGWTQAKLARKIRTNQSSIARAEANGCSLSFLQKISDATDIPIKLHL